MKKIPYSRKIRQLDRLIKDLKTNLLDKNSTDNFVYLLKLKIKEVLNQLTFVLSKRQIISKLGALAVVFGFTFSNSVYAQSFAAPVTNPFGITNTIALAQAGIDLVDIDGDGDLDLFQGTYLVTSSFAFHENIGTANSPLFAQAIANPFGLVSVNDIYSPSPTFEDLDGDGDFDIITGDYNGDIKYFENTGTVNAPAFAAPITNPFGIVSTNSYSITRLMDLDNDGDMDLLVGEYYGNLAYFENTGTTNAPAFIAPVLNPFGITSVYALGTSDAVDLDGDGDLDLLIGEFGGEMNYFENTGTPAAPSFAVPLITPFGLSSTIGYAFPKFEDLDNDGDFDLLVNDYYGDLQYFENTEVVSVNELSNDIGVYPNPFINEVVIESSFKIEKIEIVNVSGQQVLLINNPSETIDLSNLKEGIYILKATSFDGTISMKKLRKI